MHKGAVTLAVKPFKCYYYYCPEGIWHALGHNQDCKSRVTMIFYALVSDYQYGKLIKTEAAGGIALITL